MAEKLTPQQREAVLNRGGKLLVSAAAGSGKTKVLVDRLMSYLEDPVDPANIDEFLIITYTKAAAAELRGKIAAKLSERIALAPENRHLQRQFQRLYLTQISTVHAFCSVLLKEYAYLPDIPVDFRVGDENECAELRLNAVKKVLEQSYADASNDPDFCAFVDSQGFGRDDRQVPEIILKVYDSARCHLQPQKWLDHCLACTEAKGVTDAMDTAYGKELADRLFDWLQMQIHAMQQCAKAADNTEGFEKPATNLWSTVQQLQALLSSTSWNEIVARKNVDFGTLRFPKNCADPELVDAIKAVRDACKKGLAKQTKYFTDSSEAVLRELTASAPAVRGLIAMTGRFEKTYDQLKRSRRILDFGDLEHKTLDLLYGKSRSGITSAARQIGNRFREVMVDEYQDSNAVQDAIYSALTNQKQNLFMVGDVKQSIYQFRLADPGIFLEKYATFADAGDAAPGEGRKVLLSRNFRSGGDVLAAVNDVFSFCMSPRVGDLSYGAQEALYEGVPHEPLQIPEVQLHCVDVREDTYVEEAAYVADKISHMLQTGTQIRHKDGFRSVKAGDIVILLRSPGSVGKYYQQALEARGIRCASGGGEDLMQTLEIGTLYSLLQVIQNPLLDIPLVAAMASPIFGFAADELASIRSAQKFSAFYDAVCAHPSEKCKKFVDVLTQLRQAARMESLTQLLETIYSLTDVEAIYGAMEQGSQRKENLQTFFQLGASFEAVGRTDLGRFLEHLLTLSQKGMLAAGDQGGENCVTIMSIHKSKGLEFPVVFLCGLSREFNTESQRAQVLCHKELGVGMVSVDHEKRLRYPTIAKGAISATMGAESLSEELRVLYVAMTRARDVLIMTYASDRLNKDLENMVLRLNMGCKELLIGEAVCPGEWVLLTALTRTESGSLFALGGKPTESTLREPLWGIYVSSAQAEDTDPATLVNAVTEEKRVENLDVMERIINFRYPYSAATQVPSKQTATQRKGREKDDEAAQYTQLQHSGGVWRQPSFRVAQQSGTQYGNAVHAAMQYLDYSVCLDAESIEMELRRLTERRLLTLEQERMIDAEKLAAFFATDIGRKLCDGGNVIREFKFSILEDGALQDPAWAGEKILLQGVVDCAILEDDGIILLDFKTDRVTDHTLPGIVEKYRPQIETYASALERIFQKPIKDKMLYFFSSNEFVHI